MGNVSFLPGERRHYEIQYLYHYGNHVLHHNNNTGNFNGIPRLAVRLIRLPEIRNLWVAVIIAAALVLRRKLYEQIRKR